MKALVLLVAVAQLSGCALGPGSAFVGQWRPRTQVDLEACLVDDGGRCLERKQVTSEVPGRRFRGAIIALPAMAVASVTQNHVSTTRLRLSPSVEVMQGASRQAVSVRAGAQIDYRAAGAFPVVVLGHLSLAERLSVRAGGGYLPYAWQHGERAFVGAQALAGLQLALSRNRSETYTVVSLEADVTWIAFAHSYRSTGLSGHFGIFF